MPLTTKGEKIKRNMTKTYGPERGLKIFHASRNKGTIKGVDRKKKKRRKRKKSKSWTTCSMATGNRRPMKTTLRVSNIFDTAGKVFVSRFSAPNR